MSDVKPDKVGAVHILVVDDEPLIREMVSEIFELSGYSCATASNGEIALQKLKQKHADVVITDIDMPVFNGIELAKTIKARFTSDIIVMTGHIRKYTYESIIDIGANDFLTKPFNNREIVLRVERVLRERSLLEEKNRIHGELKKAHEALKSSYIDTIHRLVMAAEYKDKHTGEHVARIGEYSRLIMEKMGSSEGTVKNIFYAAPMHDVGKIGITDRILLKPRGLDIKEFDIIKKHTIIGDKLLSKSESEVLKMGQQIAISHHERWDGDGYPYGLVRDKIPLVGRIVALVDNFDALISRRPYKQPYPIEMVADILKQERGGQFDPEILDLFLDNFDDFIRIRKKMGRYEEAPQGDPILSERDLNAHSIRFH